jgi:hypothetical protein
MGRSVSYLNNAEVILYFPFESEFSEDWDDMILNLQCEIKAKLPSYYKADGWDNRETKIILENSLCNIGISEYCGLVSLSVAPKEDFYDRPFNMEKFACHHANQIEKTLRKVLEDLGLTSLRKVGSFSNGEAIFEKVGV